MVNKYVPECMSASIIFDYVILSPNNRIFFFRTHSNKQFELILYTTHSVHLSIYLKQSELKWFFESVI